MPQEFSAGIIAFREPQNPKFLLLKYTKGYWSFSRGGIEHGEDSRTAAIRELKEETNLEPAKIFDGFKETAGLFYRKEGKIIHKDLTFYLAEAKEGEVKLTEHSDYGWFTFEEAMEKLQFKNDKEILKKANEFLKKYLEC
jgi:8-oxo-dGTP pyrophosphatase MutT (NUDIX family)